MRDIICGTVSGPNTLAPITIAPMWYAVSMASLRMATSVSSTFSNVSRRSLVSCHHFSLILCSVSVKEFAGITKKDPTWRICRISSGEDGTFLPGNDVAGVSIRGMVIVFDALGARNELGAMVPETAEDKSSLYFINRPYGLPDVFCTEYHHARYLHGIRVV